MTLVLLGAGGHGLVVAHLARACGLTVTAVCDPALDPGSDWHGLPVLGGDADIAAMDPARTELLNGLGKLPQSGKRQALQAYWSALGFRFPSLVHPSAWVAPDVEPGAGAQIMAGAVVQPGSRIGTGSLVNTRASVDHHGQIGDDVHLAPGVTLCGTVTVGDGAFVGAGAVVLPGLNIGRGAIVAAGAVIRRDVPAQTTAYGSKAERRDG